MMNAICLILGLMIGTPIGYFLAALMFTSAQADADAEKHGEWLAEWAERR